MREKLQEHAQLQRNLLLAQLSVFLLQLLLQAPYGRSNLRTRLCMANVQPSVDF